MSTMTRQIHAEPIPMKPELTAQPRTTKNQRSKWIRWMYAVDLAVLIAAGTLLWRANVRNAVTYETVPLERGSIGKSHRDWHAECQAQ
jgi:hypothetical protein